MSCDIYSRENALPIDDERHYYQGRFYGPSGDDLGTCYVEIVEDEGHYWITDGDSVVREDAGADNGYESLAHARKAASDLADSSDESR